MIAVYLLIGFIPAILLVEIGRSRRSGADQPEGYTAWANFVSLGLILVGMAALLAVTLLGSTGSMVGLVLLPTLCALVAESCLSLLWILARLVARQELPGLRRLCLQFLLALGVLAALGAWGDGFLVLAGVFGGAILLVGQWMGEAKGGKAVLAYLLLVGLLLLAVWQADTYKDYTAFSPALDLLMHSLLVLAPGLAITFVFTVLRRSLEEKQPAAALRLLRRGLLVLPVILLVAWQAATLSAWDVATDGLGGVFLLELAFVIGAAAAARQSWHLPTRLTPALWGLALLLIFTILGANAFGTFGFDGEWGNVPRSRTARRAESINRAIIAYHEDQGSYPQVLSDLWPRYLWYMPTPFIIPRQNWCYQGGLDYYRLGYVYREYFSTPASVKVHASVGQPPEASWTCEAEAEKYPGP